MKQIYNSSNHMIHVGRRKCLCHCIRLNIFVSGPWACFCICTCRYACVRSYTVSGEASRCLSLQRAGITPGTLGHEPTHYGCTDLHAAPGGGRTAEVLDAPPCVVRSQPMQTHAWFTEGCAVQLCQWWSTPLSWSESGRHVFWPD